MGCLLIVCMHLYDFEEIGRLIIAFTRNARHISTSITFVFINCKLGQFAIT